MSDWLKITTTLPLALTHAAGWTWPLTLLASRIGFGGQSAALPGNATSARTGSTTPSRGRVVIVNAPLRQQPLDHLALDQRQRPFAQVDQLLVAVDAEQVIHRG